MDGKRLILEKSNMVHLALILSVSIILIVAMVASSTFVRAGEDEEVVVPEWYEGDSWEYEIRERLAPEMTLVTESEKEVIGERNYEVDIVEGGIETYESYVVEEKHVREVEEDEDDDEDMEDITGEFGYTKDTLSPITTQPHGDVLGVYHPPLRELDFPFSVGDNWTYDEGYFLEEQPGDDPAEPVRYIIQYQGKVEEKVTRNVNGNNVEAYMVNFTILAEDLDAHEDPLEWRRQEIYFSPEVKNVIHREMYQTMNIPEDEGVEEGFAREENVGNETLVTYDIEEYEPQNGEGETSLLGFGIILLIIGVVGASFVIYKKVKSPD